MCVRFLEGCVNSLGHWLQLLANWWRFFRYLALLITEGQTFTSLRGKLAHGNTRGSLESHNYITSFTWIPVWEIYSQEATENRSFCTITRHILSPLYAAPDLDKNVEQWRRKQVSLFTLVLTFRVTLFYRKEKMCRSNEILFRLHWVNAFPCDVHRSLLWWSEFLRSFGKQFIVEEILLSSHHQCFERVERH